MPGKITDAPKRVIMADPKTAIILEFGQIALLGYIAGILTLEIIGMTPKRTFKKIKAASKFWRK